MVLLRASLELTILTAITPSAIVKSIKIKTSRPRVKLTACVSDKTSVKTKIVKGTARALGWTLNFLGLAIKAKIQQNKVKKPKTVLILMSIPAKEIVGTRSKGRKKIIKSQPSSGFRKIK